MAKDEELRCVLRERRYRVLEVRYNGTSNQNRDELCEEILLVLRDTSEFSFSQLTKFKPCGGYLVSMARIYLASPLGFTEAGRFFLRSKLIPALQQTGNTVVDPWSISTDLAEKLQLAMSNSNIVQLKATLHAINNEICRRNESALRECDAIVAVLDGQEVDSGVAAEVGFAYALSKRIFGYRGDFRLSGDNLGAKVNLQVDGWIELSGGTIFSSVEELAEGMAGMRHLLSNHELMSQTVVSK